MSAIYKRGNAVMSTNLTSMIDVIFLLIVFFVLVSQIVDAENVEMVLPAPDDPATSLPGDEQRVVINVIPGTTGETIDGYKIGTKKEPFAATIEGTDKMADYLAGLFRINPNIEINLRADRSTHFEWVEPAMQAITLAAGRVEGDEPVEPRVNLVVVREKGTQ